MALKLRSTIGWAFGQGKYKVSTNCQLALKSTIGAISPGDCMISKMKVLPNWPDSAYLFYGLFYKSSLGSALELVKGSQGFFSSRTVATAGGGGTSAREGINPVREYIYQN